MLIMIKVEIIMVLLITVLLITVLLKDLPIKDLLTDLLRILCIVKNHTQHQ